MEDTLEPIYADLKSANARAGELFPPWQPAVLESWRAPAEFSGAAKFGQMDVEVEKLAEAKIKDRRLALPGPGRFSVPLCLAYPEQGSILFETADKGHDEAIGALNNIILRLLATAPPGRLNFTILDPVGLGQNFAGIMHLADYEEQIINSRIWTQSGQIEQKLADLNEHMEKVIQMYLRNEYATIAEYNEQAGVIAEKYYFLVVADFPANFTETAAKRLLSIAASGARCGVYMLIHWDQRQPLPPEFLPDELRASSVCLSAKGKQFLLGGKPIPGTDLLLDAPPAPEFAIEFVNKVGLASRDSSRVEVPFAHVAPPESEIWTGDTASELRVPDRPHGRDQVPIPGDREGDLPARADRGQDRLRQVHPVPCHDHQPGVVVQPGAGGVLPGGFQEGRRVQVLRQPPASPRAGGGHRERPRVRLERAPARG